MKCCAWCQKVKLLSEFSPHKRNKDGRHSYCRNCINDRYKNKFKENPELRKKDNLRCRIYRRTKSGIDLSLPVGKARKAGKGYIDKNGYRVINIDGYRKDGRVMEHVHIMSQHLGRKLYNGENIHHKNGIRHDNRLENLEIWTSKHPAGQRAEDRIQWCREFVALYGYKLVKEE